MSIINGASLNRRVYKRRANTVIRKVNEWLAKDEGIKGRFYIHQHSTIESILFDHSGRNYVVVIDLIDRVTGTAVRRLWDASYWNNFNSSRLWNAVNDFIMDTCGYRADSKCEDYSCEVAHGKSTYLPHSPHTGDAPLNYIRSTCWTWC